MCSVYRLPVAKNHDFGKFWHFVGSYSDPIVPLRVKFAALQETDGIHLCTEFRIDGYILAPSGGKKPQCFAIFWTSAFLWCCHSVAMWRSRTWVHNYNSCPVEQHQNHFCTPMPWGRNCAHKLMFTSMGKRHTNKLETVSITEPLCRADHIYFHVVVCSFSSSSFFSSPNLSRRRLDVCHTSPIFGRVTITLSIGPHF